MAMWTSAIVSVVFTMLLVVLPGQIMSWHGFGHYTVAYIAQSYLLKQNFEALKWANNILSPLTVLCGENLYPFVESATWMDKIRDGGWNLHQNHHFDSNYWFDEGAPVKSFPVKSNANATFGIQDSIDTLMSTETDADGNSKSIFGKSISLRMLMH